jgi:hypothetical protein
MAVDTPWALPCPYRVKERLKKRDRALILRKEFAILFSQAERTLRQQKEQRYQALIELLREKGIDPQQL